MTEIEYDGHSYPLLPGETVLEALLRQGVLAAHSCKAGSCGSCMMRSCSGHVPERAQAGLKDSWKAQGYFLPCVCVPDRSMSIGSVGADARVAATITALELLSSDVMLVRLWCDSALTYSAGQYVTLSRAGSVARSYSIACLPPGNSIELHVRRIAGGKMSGWLHSQARVGDRVSVQGPSGDCFYVPGNPAQPLLLAGTGTGLAPLYGILRDALRNGHHGPIHLFHGALLKAGLYLTEELRALAAAQPHVSYTPAVLDGDESDGVAVGAIDQLVLTRFPKLTGWRAYLCGDPALVKSLRKKFFLAGAASKDLYVDSFLPAA